MAATSWRNVVGIMTVAGALVLAGCGVKEDAVSVRADAHTGARGAEALRQAGVATSNLKSFRMSMAMDVGGAKGMSTTGDAEVDLEHRREHMSMSVNGFGANGIKEEMVVDGASAYMKLPAGLGSGLGAGASGKPWLKVTVAGLGGIQPGALQLGGSQGLLDYLSGVSGGVKFVGREQVRGVDTNHMRASVDLTKAMDRLPKSKDSKMQGAMDQMKSMMTGFQKLPVDVWVSDDGYVRRLKISFDMSGMLGAKPSKSSSASAASMGSMSETIELYDFDKPVDIQVPPPDQVSTLNIPKHGH